MVTLAVETSTATFAAAVDDRGRRLTRTLPGVPPGRRNLPGLVAGLLAEAGCAFADLRRVAVDVGPGNLTAVRTGVAYANGLAFALGIGIATADSLELMAAQYAGTDPGTPVLCLRNAGGGRAYAGLFRPDRAPLYRHGRLRDAVAELAGQCPEVVTAGDFRSQVAELLPQVPVGDSGIAGPDACVLLAVTADRPVLDPAHERAASPLTETSALFRVAAGVAP